MNTKNKRVSHPKHLKNQIYLGFLKELKSQLDMDSTVSTSKIAEQFHVSHQIVSILRKSGGIRKIGIGKHEWKLGEPTMLMVDEINNQLACYRMNLKKENGSIEKPKIENKLLNNEMEFDFDAPDVGKRETLGERQMRKSTEKIKLDLEQKAMESPNLELIIDTPSLKAWEAKATEQKAEKSDVPLIAPTDSSMISEFIDHERHYDFIHLSKWEKTIVFGMIGLIAMLIISVAVITYFVIKQI
jgi:hypothetical protein